MHILGEQGLLGFLAFMYLISTIYYYLKRHPESKFLQEGLIFTFFNLFIMSFTEHRFTSPSNALPFVLIFCLYVIYINGLRKNEYISKQQSA